MANILVVEDEDILREVLADYLTQEGHKALEAADGQIALELFEANAVDLVILDITLPKLDGWSVCRRIRKAADTPILMLTARADEDDSLLGFELGADDYLIKPYSPKILMAKVKWFLNRRQFSEEAEISAGGISMDTASRCVTVEGAEVGLTYTEFEILLLLMQSRGFVISREQLISKIWGYDFYGDEKTVNSHIRNLRAKLGVKGGCIVTVVRLGYKFVEDSPT